MTHIANLIERMQRDSVIRQTSCLRARQSWKREVTPQNDASSSLADVNNVNNHGPLITHLGTI